MEVLLLSVAGLSSEVGPTRKAVDEHIAADYANTHTICQHIQKCRFASARDTLQEMLSAIRNAQRGMRSAPLEQSKFQV